jgi:homoserine kinase
LLKALGDTTTGFAFKLHKKMPIGSGLGSSAASAAAGAYVVNMLLKQPFEKRHLLPFALEGEAFASGAKHADNVAPALLGGIQLIRDNATLDLHRIYSPKGLHVVVVYPEIEMLTKDARNLLSPNITLKQHVSQSANLAALIVGLTNTDFDLIGRSLRDQIIEPQRAGLIPHFYDVQAAAMTAGALGCSISGAGPSIFAMCKNTLEAENISAAMSAVFTQQKIKHQCFISDINHDGAVLV